MSSCGSSGNATLAAASAPSRVWLGFPFRRPTANWTQCVRRGWHASNGKASSSSTGPTTPILKPICCDGWSRLLTSSRRPPMQTTTSACGAGSRASAHRSVPRKPRAPLGRSSRASRRHCRSRTVIRPLPVYCRSCCGVSVSASTSIACNARRPDATKTRRSDSFSSSLGKISNERQLVRAAAPLRDRRRRKVRMFFSGAHGPHALAATRRNTPPEARRWGFLMNMRVDSFRSTFAKFARP